MIRRLLKHGLVDLVFANFLMQFMGFGVLILLPRFVGADELGSIKVMQSYADLLLILAGWGMNTAVIKICSEERPTDDLESILRLAVIRTLAVSVGAYVLITVAAVTGILSSSDQINSWLPIYSLLIPFGALTSLFVAYLQARKRIREMARAQTVVKLQSVVLLLGAAALFGFRGFLIASVIAYAVGLWPFIRQIGIDFLRAERRPSPTGFSSIAGYSLLGNLLNTVGKYADIFVLGMFVPDPEEMGYYALATIFLIAGSVITSSVQTMAIPFLSERFEDRRWFRRAMYITQLETLAVAVLAALAIRLGAWMVVSYLYEPAYAASLGYLDILLIFFVLKSGYSILGGAFIAMGRTQYNFWAGCVTAVVGLTLSYVGLQVGGFDGVAWSKVVTALVSLATYFGIAIYSLRRTAPDSGGAA